MLGQLIEPEISEMIAKREFGALRRALQSFASASIAELFIDLQAAEMTVLFRILPRDRAAEVFEYLPLEQQEALMHELGTDQVAQILNEMAPDDRTALLEELPGPVTRRLIALLTPQERAIATQLLGYPESSVGRLMTPDYISVRENLTVGQVLDHIRKVGHDKETLNVIYVVDEKGTLLDDIRLRELILAEPEAPVSSLMDRQFVTLRADQDQEESVRAFQQYDRVALPVVDSSGLLVGMITVDDVMDVAEEEATEDIQKIGGMEAIDASYLNTGFWRMIRKRGGWLSVLFVGEMLTATAMGYFEAEIAKAVVLALFVPLIISSGGNTGSQASTLIVRSLALQELRLGDWWRVLMRELRSGLTLGAWLGLIGFVQVLVGQSFGWIDYGEHYLRLGVTVWISLTGVVAFGSTTGSMLPFFLRAVHLDPATSSAPFVATLVDVTGLIIYFSVATLVLRGALL
jgi:magnesium transporter